MAGLAAALLVAGGWFGAGLPVQRVALIRGVLMALDVLPIIWGAYMFYRVTAEAGAIDALSEALPVLTPTRGLQALVIGWAFTSFLQGVGGFGVPVAVTAPILAGLGFRPGDCRARPVDWACVGGDVRIAGLGVSGDGSGDGTTGGTIGARLGAGIGDRWPGLRDLRCAGGRRLEGNGAAWSGDRRHGGCDGCVPVWPGRLGLWPIASVGAALVGMGIGLIAARRRLPDGASLQRLGFGLQGYVVLVGLISLVQFVPPLSEALHRWTVSVSLGPTTTLLGHSMPAMTYRYQPLGHPGTLLVYAAVLAYALYRWRGSAIGRGAPRRIAAETIRPMLPVTLGLLAMVAMAAVMEQAGMIQALAAALAASAGGGFALVSPWIGALGAFVTGSNTSSNLIFGALQARAAGLLGIDLPLVLALQNVGGALGSVVSPTKVIVAVSTLGLIGQEGA